MTLLTILSLLGFHWIADFVKQTDYQANYKSIHSGVLAEHCVIYTLWMGIGAVIFRWLPTAAYIPFFMLITFLSHFIIDYVTSRVNSRLYHTGEYHYFFVSVGFDQLLHYAVIFSLINWIS